MRDYLGFKFKLRPTSEQRQKLAHFAGCSRFVWNRAMTIMKNELDKTNRCMGYQKMAGKLRDWKNEEPTSFLRSAHSQSLQATLRDLDKAYLDAFQKKRNFPRFKTKENDSFRYPQGIKMENNQVFLPKIGWVKFVKSRDIEGDLNYTTVSFECGHWYVSFNTELECESHKHPGGEVGIDLGVRKFATLSNGEIYESPRPFEKYLEKLAVEQRKLSLKEKGSNRYEKQKNRVLRIYRKIVNVRKDFLHKTSTAICKKNAFIGIEDLDVSNMSRSRKSIGKNSKFYAKRKSSKFNRSILDQGWFEFRKILEYKSRRYGASLVAVPPQYTSMECRKCGCCDRKNRKKQELFKCIQCDHLENADLNASHIILRDAKEIFKKIF